MKLSEFHGGSRVQPAPFYCLGGIVNPFSLPICGYLEKSTLPLTSLCLYNEIRINNYSFFHRFFMLFSKELIFQMNSLLFSRFFTAVSSAPALPVPALCKKPPHPVRHDGAIGSKRNYSYPRKLSIKP